MTTGFVTTARGGKLNLNKLIENSKRPAGLKEAKSEITTREIPGRNPITVRGVMPAQGLTPVPQMPQTSAPHSIPVVPEAIKQDHNVTLAELTAIHIDTAKHVRPAAPGETGMSPKDLAEQVVLKDVLDGLQKQAPAALAEAERIEKAQKRGKKTGETDI